jgi:hypothetical protein
MQIYLSWLENSPDKREVVGSSPTICTKYGHLAQLGERSVVSGEVTGSKPVMTAKYTDVAQFG